MLSARNIVPTLLGLLASGGGRQANRGILSGIRALKGKCHEGDTAGGVCPPLPEGRRESMGEGGRKKKQPPSSINSSAI